MARTMPSIHSWDPCRVRPGNRIGGAGDSRKAVLQFLDEANRANASFYPIDPRGLPVFDSPIGPDKPLPLAVDAAMLRTRQNSIRTLAEATDGLAIVNTNQIAGGLKRIVADLSSYYLLGYYASNVKMDGKFHKITVRIKRPGVQVRARRGYLAPTESELNRPLAPRGPVDSSAARRARRRHRDSPGPLWILARAAAPRAGGRRLEDGHRCRCLGGGRTRSWTGLEGWW